ncbi:MAG: hypothetical protein JSR78_18025 [Proteobacteria bacterium]|nr:hypothetical protein [Pseudomonadota bacterium]
MRFSGKIIAAFGLAATIAVASAASANAECKRYGFTVNDYGKDGPTNDAKSLLDKLISDKMSEKGVKDYRTGKKSVSCEMFLNFIVFDEHTCTAEATVCWGASKLPGAEKTSAEDAAPAKNEETASEEKHAKKKAAKEAAVHTEAAPAQAEATPAQAEAAPAHKTAAAQSVPDPKSLIYNKMKKHAEHKEASATSPVETGSIAETKHATHKSDDVAPIKQTSGGEGYPTPESPTDGDAAQ